ncbi:MAG TPA: rhodanese-like domain-containing protein [Chitinophagaceae bacterium]|nr:rhodanese-like domain-containing protein [Chitinophagaceae bacterium]
MKTITVEELKKRLDNGEDVHLLDVRENHERADYNIGGVHIPLGKVQAMQLDEIEDWKDDEVIVYCRSGNRSGMAAMFMEQAGFKNPVNLTGGMLAWREKYS